MTYRKLLIASILSTAALAAIPATAGARLFYVDRATGSDAASGEEVPIFSGNVHPWRTLEHASKSIVNATDTVLIEPGSYPERLATSGGNWIGSVAGPVNIGEVYVDGGSLSPYGQSTEERHPTVVQRVNSCFLIAGYVPGTTDAVKGNQLWVRFLEDRMSECEYTAKGGSEFTLPEAAIVDPLLPFGEVSP